VTYATIAQIQGDGSIRQRVTACVAVQGIAGPPEQWAADHAWKLAAHPGWADAWEASAGDQDRSAAITDEMIDAAVHAIRQGQG